MRSAEGWKFNDVFFLMAIHFLAAILTFLLYGPFIKNEEIRQESFQLVCSLFSMFLPVLWVKRRYNLNKEALQIKKGRWSFKRTATIGLSTGIACFLFDSIMMGPGLVEVGRFIVANPLTVLLLPLSLRTGVAVFLTPIGEEILFRGFIYGYLRVRLGTRIGLLVQAVIFSLLHLDFFSPSFSYLLIQRVVFGLVFGVLCVVSSSIYPGIVSHGVTNYFIHIASLTQLGGR